MHLNVVCAAAADASFTLSLRRAFGAAEGSGHSGGEELAGDLGQRGEHDGGLLHESVQGPGQVEGGEYYH